MARCGREAGADDPGQFAPVRRRGVSARRSPRSMRWLPFLRVGYAEGGGAPLERSFGTGFAYYPSGDGSVFGLGINWGHPNRDSFDASTDDQYTLDTYYRFQLLERLAITPDLQLIKQPAQNPGYETVWIAGLRARVVF